MNNHFIYIYIYRLSCVNQTKSSNNVLLSTHGSNTVLENISCIYGSKQVNYLGSVSVMYDFFLLT